MYSREGKYTHAAAFNFLSGCDLTKITNQNKRRSVVVTIACNFPKDGCIDFSDLKTFFHEFGHVMHQICSKPQIYQFAAFSTERDFVEAPSQFCENWVYTQEGLNLMSQHIETGEAVPLEIINKLKKLKNCMIGYFYKGQLHFSFFDQKLHSMKFTNDDEPLDIQQIWYQIQEEVYGIEPSIKLHPFASFGHLVNEYDASYYGYLRAETFAVNMFQKMFNDGSVLDSEKGINYRKKILEPGATKDALDLLKDYLNEEPNDDYFLKDKIVDS
jgi:Zn-dependent oligopeptidase